MVVCLPPCPSCSLRALPTWPPCPPTHPPSSPCCRRLATTLLEQVLHLERAGQAHLARQQRDRACALILAKAERGPAAASRAEQMHSRHLEL